MNIDDGKRENHLLEIDLIHGAQPLNEMGRRIDVRSPLSDMCENLRKESSAHCVGALLIPINCFPRFIRKPRPSRNARPELVRKIYILILDQRLLNLPNYVFVGTLKIADAILEYNEQTQAS